MENIWNFRMGDAPLLLGGDFNCVEGPAKDKLGGNPMTGTTGLAELCEFTGTNNLMN
jgi:hypothetical protein